MIAYIANAIFPCFLYEEDGVKVIHDHLLDDSASYHHTHY